MRNLRARRSAFRRVATKYTARSARGTNGEAEEEVGRRIRGRRDCGHGIFRGRPWICAVAVDPILPNSLSRSNLIGRPQRVSTADLV